jgi:hypothetical protein
VHEEVARRQQDAQDSPRVALQNLIPPPPPSIVDASNTTPSPLLGPPVFPMFPFFTGPPESAAATTASNHYQLAIGHPSLLMSMENPRWQGDLTDSESTRQQGYRHDHISRVRPTVRCAAIVFLLSRPSL